MEERQRSYKIRIEGHLDPGWSERLGGLAIRRCGTDSGPTTTLTGRVRDQSALRGIIDALMDLRFEVVSVERLGAREE
jgi:hypothetical protein